MHGQTLIAYKTGMVFRLPDIYPKHAELDNSVPWKILQGPGKPVDKIYILMNKLARAEEKLSAKSTPAGKAPQLSLFDTNAEHLASYAKTPEPVAKEQIEIWENRILSRCKTMPRSDSPNRSDYIDYYVSVYGLRKILGLSKQAPLASFETGFPLCPPLDQVTQNNSTVPSLVEALKINPQTGWIGHVFGSWLDRAAEQRNAAIRNNLRKISPYLQT